MWRSFAALGDSFTEGLVDEVGADGRYRGWADRVAEHLATRVPDFRYANLAVRGRLLEQIAREQVPIAQSMRADLVSIAGGVNDAMRRNFDVDASATYLENSVRTLRAGGSDVLIFAFGDPTRRSPSAGALRRRLAAFNSAARAIALAHQCFLVDFWGLAVFDDDALWDPDRLHLAPAGHAVVTQAVLETLGVGGDAWRTPAPRTVAALPTRALGNAHWFGAHALPWFGRRIRGLSSGDGITAKRPVLAPLSTKPLDTD